MGGTLLTLSLPVVSHASPNVKREREREISTRRKNMCRLFQQRVAVSKGRKEREGGEGDTLIHEKSDSIKIINHPYVKKRVGGWLS